MKINDYLIKAAQTFNNDYNFRIKCIQIKEILANEIIIEVGYAAIDGTTKKQLYSYNTENN